MNHGPFDNQFIISYELLELLKWLFENEQDALKKIVKKSLEHGLVEDLAKAGFSSGENLDELQDTITDFFALLENLLLDSLKEEGLKKELNKSLVPSINNIDKKAYDTTTFNLSVEKATTACLNNPQINPKDILCKELLKRWKPSRKITLN